MTMTFREIINQVLKIFWFQAQKKPRFENKGNFWNKMCLRQSICIMAFLQRDICIMTYLLEDICVSISVRRHLHHGLNACTGIIMNKLCIFIPAQDICIIIFFLHFSSLSRSTCIKTKNLDLHHIFLACIFVFLLCKYLYYGV